MRASNILKILLLLIFVVFNNSCVSDQERGEWPDWVTQLALSSPGHGPITRHKIDGKIYWYFDNSKNCCDMTSNVYDENGTYICSPKGGIMGKGSGDCPLALRSYFW